MRGLSEGLHASSSQITLKDLPSLSDAGLAFQSFDLEGRNNSASIRQRVAPMLSFPFTLFAAHSSHRV